MATDHWTTESILSVELNLFYFIIQIDRTRINIKLPTRKMVFCLGAKIINGFIFRIKHYDQFNIVDCDHDITNAQSLWCYSLSIFLKYSQC